MVRLNSSRIATRLRLSRKYSVASSLFHTVKKVLECDLAHTEVYSQVNDLAQRCQQLKLLLNSSRKDGYYTAIIQILRMTHDLVFSNRKLTDLALHNTDKDVGQAIDGLERIGHYYRAARRRKSRLFRNIRVLSWDLKVPLRVRRVTEPGRSIALLRTLNCEIGESKFLERFTGSESIADRAVTKRLNEARSGLKVHAEMKMLLFYECGGTLRPPRIIAASKSSCYLCDLFFSIHGAFQVLATFGRFNERWILPDWISPPQTMRLAESVRQFDRMLTLILQRMIVDPKRRPQPVESVIGLSASWSSLPHSVLFPKVTEAEHIAKSACSHSADELVVEPSNAEPFAEDSKGHGRIEDSSSITTGEVSMTPPQSLIQISDQELPFLQQIHCDQQAIRSISISKLTLIFESSREACATLHISRGDETRVDHIQTIDILTIPKGIGAYLNAIQEFIAAKIWVATISPSDSCPGVRGIKKMISLQPLHNVMLPDVYRVIKEVTAHRRLR